MQKGVPLSKMEFFSTIFSSCGTVGTAEQVRRSQFLARKDLGD
jgi:hypothetical protein